MLTNLRISVRLALGIGLTLLLVLLLMLPAVLGQLNSITNRAETRQLSDLHSTLRSRITDASLHATSLALTAVSAPGVADAFAAKDREQLQKLTLPVFEALKKTHNVQQMQFHLSPALSFLRLHQLEKFDDNLSAFRKTVVLTNQRQMEQYGLENGVAGLGLRGVIPVYRQNVHIGSAEVGVSFGQDFLDLFSKQYGAPAAIHVQQMKVVDGQMKNETAFKIFASTIPNKSTLDKEQLADIMKSKTPVTEEIERDGKSWAVMAVPLKDFSGEPIGVVEIMIDRSDYAKSHQSTMKRILGIGLVALMVGLMLAWLLSRTITRPIEHLTEVADAVSRGKFEHQIIGTDRKDEIGALSRAVSRMASSIKIAMERMRKTS